MKNLLSAKIMLTVALIMFTANVKAQDILAGQAPIDNKKSLIDSLKVKSIIKNEIEEFPSLGLYLSWDNSRAHTMDPNIVIPDSCKIDLTGFVMPTKNTRLTSKFGPRRRRMHKGLDIKVQVGDSIYAAFSGKIRIVKDQGRRKGYGKYVIIRHENGLETVYGHLSKQLVKENQRVEAGEVIGLGGNTGRSSGSHLHFETRFLGIAINPELMFNFPEQDIVSNTFTFYKADRRHIGNHVRYSSKYKPSGKSSLTHRVKNGDTLSKIAKKYGISVAQLCKINNLKTNSTLRVGQVIRCS